MIYKIHLLVSDVTLEYDSVVDKHLSILDKALDHKIYLKAGCRSGYCGTCRVELVAGEVKYFYTPPVAPNKEFILACSAYPVSDIKINC